MTRTEMAELALERAKREDQMDDEVHPCRVCGRKPQRIFIGADCSMHAGRAIMRCETDGIEIVVSPTRGDAGRAEIKAAYDKWQRLMGPTT